MRAYGFSITYSKVTTLVKAQLIAYTLESTAKTDIFTETKKYIEFTVYFNPRKKDKKIHLQRAMTTNVRPRVKKSILCKCFPLI